MEEEKELPFTDDVSHVANMGGMVEAMEGRMRDVLYEVYFGKTKDTVSAIRSNSLKAANDRKMGQQNLIKEMMAKRGGE